MQLPLQHSCPGAQAVPQAPQCSRVSRSTHRPLQQPCPWPQVTLQAPQCSVVFKGTQVPPQQPCPLVQLEVHVPVVGAQTSHLLVSQAVLRQVLPQIRSCGQHTPAMQFCPDVHFETHLPCVASQTSHLVGSQAIERQVPPQTLALGQHAPFMQDSPAAQGLPQVPQFCWLARGLTHSPMRLEDDGHTVCPGGQAHAFLAVQVAPLGQQRLPQTRSFGQQTLFPELSTQASPLQHLWALQLWP